MLVAKRLIQSAIAALVCGALITQAAAAAPLSTAGGTAKVIEDRFTAPEKANPLPYPQARLHTQWPGTGLAGDRVFDHSLGGGPGWAIADARPALVEAIIAMEPSPQPATNNLARGPYGISYTPLTFRPATSSGLPITACTETPT
jgi:hypothetical protein